MTKLPSFDQPSESLDNKTTRNVLEHKEIDIQNRSKHIQKDRQKKIIKKKEKQKQRDISEDTLKKDDIQK